MKENLEKEKKVTKKKNLLDNELVIKKESLDSLEDETLKIVYDVLDQKKCENIVMIDVKEKSSIADYIVITSIKSSKQLNSVSHEIKDKLKEYDFDIRNIDGELDSKWVIIDLYSILIHLMSDELRHYYELEKLWLIES
jgi:ribosome-associated protein